MVPSIKGPRKAKASKKGRKRIKSEMAANATARKSWEEVSINFLREFSIPVAIVSYNKKARHNLR